MDGGRWVARMLAAPSFATILLGDELTSKRETHGDLSHDSLKGRLMCAELYLTGRELPRIQQESPWSPTAGLVGENGGVHRTTPPRKPPLLLRWHVAGCRPQGSALRRGLVKASAQILLHS